MAGFDIHRAQITFDALDTDTGEVTTGRIAANPEAVVGRVSPAFSPDGSRIVFTSNRDGDAEIYVMEADGTDLARVTNNGARDFDPAFSADGSRIAFTSDRDSNAGAVHDPRRRLATAA